MKYQIINRGKKFWHVIEAATGKAVGFRVSLLEAKCLALRLEKLQRMEQGLCK